MIAENKDIANLYDIEYEAGCFVNSYDYKFVTFIRVIRKVRLLAAGHRRTGQRLQGGQSISDFTRGYGFR